MAKKKHEQEPSITGGSSLLSRYSGKTKSIGGFHPIWKPANPGEEVLATFVSMETVEQTGKGKKDFQSCVLSVKEGNITLIKSKTLTVPCLQGQMFTVSGEVICTALKDAKPGEDYILIYSGMGEAKGGNNAPKLFEVHALVA